MATKNFKGCSPYKQKGPVIPVEDYLYKKYENDIKAVQASTIKKRNVALFGAGRAGTIHLATLVNNPRVNLMYVVDDVPGRFAQMKQYWGLENTTFLTSKDANLVYKDPNVSVVIVTAPTHTHESIVKNSISANKAVFCEKPISENSQVTSDCYKKAQEVGKPLFCAFNRRFDPSYGTIRERVHKGEVGFVYTVKVCSRDSPLPTIDYLKNSGGIFHDCAVHDIDMVCWIIGEYPIRVSTIATANIEEIAAINDYDTVAITMQFPSGTIGMIDLSRNSCYGYDQRLEVFGEKGMIKADNEQPIHCVTTQNGLTGIKSAPIWYSFVSRYHRAYITEMEHFLDVVDGTAVSKVKGLEILAVTKIASAVEESARTGKTVELKWSAGELSTNN